MADPEHTAERISFGRRVRDDEQCVVCLSVWGAQIGSLGAWCGWHDPCVDGQSGALVRSLGKKIRRCGRKEQGAVPH